MHKKHLMIGAVILTLVLFAGLVGLRIQQKNAREAALKEQVPPPTAVAVSQPRRGNMSDSLQLPGNVVAREEVQIVPKASGRLMTLLVQEGSPVRAGQLLGEIDHLELDAQMAQARASAQVAKANLDQLVNGPLQTQIAQAKASVSQLESSLAQLRVSQAQSERDLARQQTLLTEGVVTQQQYETARAQLDGLRQQIMGMQQQIAGARASLQQLLDGNRPEQIEGARGQYNQALATIRLYEAQLANYRLISPISGVVTQKQLDAGNLVAAPSPILTIAQNASPEIEMFLPERELPRVKLRQAVEIRSSSLPNQVLKAVIGKISPVVDPQTRLVKLTAYLTPSRPLKAGMLLDCRIVLEQRSNTLTVPPEAIIQEDNKSVVYVTVNNQVESRPVQLGLRSPSEVEIRKGLKPQEQVIVKGASYVRPGDKVQVQAAAKEVL
ncbi:MAG: efflux RND transporter periplasmic adaptor subunit [Candidatus Sericytochromatia bacterium]